MTVHSAAVSESPLDHWLEKTPREIVDEFVLIRGDLGEEYAREALAAIWQHHIDAVRSVRPFR